MKKAVLILSAAAMICLLSSCGKAETAKQPAKDETYQVTIPAGDGSKTYTVDNSGNVILAHDSAQTA